MMAYAIAQGVPAEDIQPDYAGRRTYDTCYRAKAIFQIESAVLVTQRFHLPRALFLCDQLGIKAVGVAADQRVYDPRSVAFSETREVPALVVALLDVIRRAPPPVLGEPIPLK
jgi:SanA protein